MGKLTPAQRAGAPTYNLKLCTSVETLVTGIMYPSRTPVLRLEEAFLFVCHNPLQNISSQKAQDIFHDNRYSINLSRIST